MKKFNIPIKLAMEKPRNIILFLIVNLFLGLIVYSITRLLSVFLQSQNEYAKLCWNTAKSSSQVDLLSASVVAVIIAVVIQPLIEELVFRKFIIDRFAGKFTIVAALTSAVLFSLAHYQYWYENLHVVNLISVAVSGFALALCYEARKSVWDSFAVHVAYNGVILIPKTEILCDYVQRVTIIFIVIVLCFVGCKILAFRGLRLTI